MRLTRKKTLLAWSLTLSMVLTLAASGGALAADKHPGANPSAAMNPCSMKNPCAANPCSMKNPCSAKQTSSQNVPIRNWPLKDYKKVVERGELLWNDTRLGASGTSCASCHPNGALLNAKPYPKHIKMTGDIVTLDQMINFCMINPMKAKPLAWNSQKLTALAAYVTEQTLNKKNPCSMNPCAAKNPCSMKNPCGN